MPLNQSQIQESFLYEDADVKSLVPSILKLNLQQDSSENYVINSLNKQLSIPKCRLEALEFLNVLIPSCSKELIVDNALNWLNYCSVLNREDGLKEIKLITIGNIIEHAYTNQEFTKKFISEHITKVLDCCISVHENPQEIEAALKTLTICMKRYGSWFSIHKAKIESYLLDFSDNSSEVLVDQAAVAYLYFQQVGGAGIEGINHKTNFSSTFHKLCVTIHNLFEEFFENELELEHYDVENEEHYIFTTPNCDSEKMMHLTARRIKNCLRFLKPMLLKGFPVAKEIKPMDLFGVISRGTALHKCLSSKMEKSLQEFQFSLLLTDIQTDLLQLLRILLIWLKTNSLPFTYTISKILIDCLNRSQNCRCFESDKKFQRIIFTCFIDWIKCVKCSLHVRFQTQLVDCILQNITPIKNEISLSVQNDSSNISRKSKKKSMQNRIIASGQQNDSSLLFSDTEKEAQIKLCSLSLETLKELLNYTRLKIDAKKIQELYSVVIENLLKINSFKTCHPYTDLECQEKLYEVLVAFYEQENLTILPPISLTIDILNKGASSKHRNVRFICDRGLNVLEKLCQPVCPSLYVPEMFNSNVETMTEERHNKSLLDNSYEMEVEQNGMMTSMREDNISTAMEELEIEEEPNEQDLNHPNENDAIVINDEIDDHLTPEINNGIKFNDTELNNSEQENVQEEAIEVPKVSINVIDVQVLPPVIEVSDDDGSLSGTETVLFENYVEQESNKVSQEDTVEKEQIKIEMSNNCNEASPVRRPSSPSSEETFERPSKLSKLDTDTVSKKNKEADTEEFNLSDDEFVDEVKEY